MSWLSDVDEPYEQYDEADIRERPNRKGTKPRTKQRPEHDDAQIGRVVGVDRGRYSLVVRDGEPDEAWVTAARARELRRQPIVVGDLVDVVGDTTGDEGTLARIVRIRPRTTLLRRSADDTDQIERVIVANADQLLMVVAAADPPPRPRLIDRYLVASYDAGIAPILVITKTDVADPIELLRQFEGLDMRIVLSRKDDPPLAELHALLDGHISVAVGHSGVGKSTLVNALVPDAHRATSHVNAVTGRGRHTSSSTEAYRMGTGWIIDTPGVRSFGLGHVNPDNVARGFPDLQDIIEECPRGCTHLAGAPDCALDTAVAEGRADAGRVESLRRLLSSVDARAEY